ncbi:hypothetical protein Droror1_Dr00012450 [Drosera rotundifolia]
MEREVKANSFRALDIDISNSIKNDQVQEYGQKTAHTIDHDSWKQVGLLLATCFNCGWILSFSNLIMVPLGWEWGITALAAIGLFTAYANWLLAGFHFIDGQRFIRYKDIMGFLFGRHMYYITWINQFFIFLLGNMGFIVLGGRGLKDINAAFSDSPLRLQYHIVITGVAYFTFALVVPNMSSMRAWLGVSVVLTFGYIGFMLPVLVNDGNSHRSRSYKIEGSKADKVSNGLGALAAIIVCNTSGMLLEIQSTLRKPAVNNMRKALFVQYTLGLTVYYGVCIMGYWAYGTSVSDYLPNNLTGPKWANVVANSGVYLQNIVSQHMFLQPVHEALDTKFLKLDKSINSRQNLQRRFVLRALLFTATTFVAAALPFIGDFINFLGSFALIPLTFIFPSMIFLKVKRNTANAAQKAWHWTIIIFSSLLAVATTASAVRLIVKDVTQYHFFANT